MAVMILRPTRRVLLSRMDGTSLLLFDDSTVAAGSPAVAVGVGTSAPFIASAKEDSSANPTAGGVPRNTV